MSLKKDHGDRNQELSDNLLQGNKFYDWSVTVAFYSAIHFVEDKIFPINIAGVSCKNISEARGHMRVKGRHQARLDLVRQNLPSILSYYSWLDDQSRNARYKTYKIKKGVAEKAQQYLKSIQAECYK